MQWDKQLEQDNYQAVIIIMQVVEVEADKTLAVLLFTLLVVLVVEVLVLLLLAFKVQTVLVLQAEVAVVAGLEQAMSAEALEVLVLLLSDTQSNKGII
jgi:hypothetical protein